jgi:arylsulfatase A-like enzyme
MTASAVSLSVLLLAACGGSDDAPAPAAPPNILFVIMDDVGIDQMRDFGYGGVTPPSMPNITEIADAGIRFHNTWSMPACTTSRAVIFEARYPLRTNVKGALGQNDLANSMVSPYEVTLPKLLAEAGYESAMFGKFHMALQGHYPAGDAMVHDLGWDYFAGWLDETGDPHSIDKTAGGVAPMGTSYPCGFVPGASQPGGADAGACYMPDGSCGELTAVDLVPPGRTCRDQGGILDPNKSCQTPPPDYVDFNLLSGHYVSPLVYNFPDGFVDRVPLTDPGARTFRATFAVDAAIDWITSRPADQPWMATVSFATVHTPLMQPPVDEAIPGSAASSGLDCGDLVAQRELSNLMIESLDLEVGRLLVEAGLAERRRDGRLLYRPEQTDTIVIVLGDNGSLGTMVKVPFDPSRAKGTAYQTGVWVPLVIAGPLVEQPDRVVSHMVNIVDLYSLFGEIAGIDDVQAAVPRPIDAMPLMPYLSNPDQASIRRWNYTEVGVNLQANGAINGPCVIMGGCTQIPVSKSVCEDNNGVWWGVGLDDPITVGAPEDGFIYCCEVNAFVVENERVDEPYNITPLVSIGIRNDRYKIVENSFNAYVSVDQPCMEMTVAEFYEIDEAILLPKLDSEGTNLPLDALTPEQQDNYDELAAELAAIRASVPDCPGDGNIDFVVDDQDLDDWRFFSETYGTSSVYDLDLDSLTNEADESIIEENLGLDCRGE